MAADDPIPLDENYLSSLIEYHESLSGSSVEAEPRQSIKAEPRQSIEAEPRPSDAEQDPELSAWLKRDQDCLRRLHAWRDEKSGSRSGQPYGDKPDSAVGSSCRPAEAPMRVGRFRVARELGRGAFGIVFLAFDPLLGREVALKLPTPQVVVTPGLCRRFLREAQAAAGLSHPNLVNVFETGAWGPAAYIASEYCAGETLAAWLQNGAEPVPVAAAATLVATLARALDYAHKQGVIHRDLKPSNIMLVSKPGSPSAPSRGVDLGELVPKITDFGLAKLLESDADETRSTAILGTPIYMAPEQAESRLGDIGPETDVYALGVILYEILTGRVPFSGTSDVETLKRVTQDEPQPLRRLRRRCRATWRPSASSASRNIPQSVIRRPRRWRTTWSGSSPADRRKPGRWDRWGLAQGGAAACGRHRALGDSRRARRRRLGRPLAGRPYAARPGPQRHHVATRPSLNSAPWPFNTPMPATCRRPPRPGRWVAARTRSTFLLATVPNRARRICATSSGITCGGCAMRNGSQSAERESGSIPWRIRLTAPCWQPAASRAPLACGMRRRAAC